MTQPTSPGDLDSITLDYSYDALERLITKQDAAVAENTTTCAHSGLEEEVVKLSESDSTSSVTSRYLHLGQAPLVMESGGQIRFFGTEPHTESWF